MNTVDKGQADTIFALSSGSLPAGIAVFRLSGPEAIRIISDVTKSTLPKPRQAALRRIQNPETGDIIDQALVILFPAPKSFTGEDVVEIHAHGGRAVAHAIDELLIQQKARPAEAGEFTKRAFHNGCLNLVEAEGLADLIHAETEAQRKLAISQMEGRLTQLYDGWRKRLLRALALIEAEIDFSDEDIPEHLFEQVRPDLRELRHNILDHLEDGHKGERLRQGIKMAILGKPNAGKSSLINMLAKRDVAIVSDVEGTTRDVIDVHLDLGGYPVTVADTAGLRASSDEIEREGIRRAIEKAEEADLKIIMIDARDDTIDPLLVAQIDDRAQVIVNKTDLMDEQSLGNNQKDFTTACYPMSVKTGQGMKHWLDAVTQWVGENYNLASKPVLTRARHRYALMEAVEHLDRALEMGRIDDVLAAEDVRLAMRAVGRITGHVDVEDLLDVIFSEFCIGK